MAVDKPFNDASGKKPHGFGPGQSWQDKVLEGDALWAQVKAALDAAGQTLPQTPRRPDVRLILNNISGQEVRFYNPGDHSGSKEETIPATGDKTAAMVMIKGSSLPEQNANAQKLFALYDLGNQGLSEKFVTDLKAGKLSDLVDEAYGPAPFQSQADKLVDVSWPTEAGKVDIVQPVKGPAAAAGARAATNETVFLAQFQIYIKGTGTTAELAEGYGMNIAVNADWQTGVESTRPIVPSVAQVYYGEHFKDIPVATVHPDGAVKEIDLKNGQVIPAAKVAKPKPARPPRKPKNP
jgi:hypothetical protein